MVPELFIFWDQYEKYISNSAYQFKCRCLGGFIALFGIATDDGVLIGTYLKQQFDKEQPKTLAAIRAVTLTAGSKRIRPAVMTTATTLIALLPVLTSSGRGSDIMIPMAIPIFGGMLVAGITYFITPVLFCWKKELDLKRENI